VSNVDRLHVYLEYLGYCVVVPEGEIIIGRDMTCALRFNDSTVSRKHLRLIRAGDHVEVEDLGSSNGTQVNHLPLDGRMALHDGDLIDVGAYRLKVIAVDDVASELITLKIVSLAQISELEKSRRPAAGRGSTTSMRAMRPTDRPTDRRMNERLPLELRVIYASSELEIEATTRNISSSGVFVCSLVLDPVGTPCDLTLLIDGGPPLRMHGIVRRVEQQDPVGLGIEFIDVGAAERTWLEIAISRMVHTATYQRADT